MLENRLFIVQTSFEPYTAPYRLILTIILFFDNFYNLNKTKQFLKNLLTFIYNNLIFFLAMNGL